MKTDEEVVVVKKDSHMNGFTYKHPSFGMVSIIHGQGGMQDVKPFGSEIFVNKFTSIAIREAEVTQSLGKNWYFDRKVITEAILTPNQFATLISSPNTSGVPCTIRYTETKGHVVPRSIDTMTRFAKDQLDKNGEGIKRQARDISKSVGEILSKKGALNKSDKEEISKLVSRLAGAVNNGFEFYERSVHNGIDKRIAEAKADIDSHITHAIAKLGIDTLNNPQAMQLLIESKESSDSKEK